MDAIKRTVVAPKLPQGNGAIIRGRYRYLLWRTWDMTRPRLLWVLLNPSTADDQTDDPTLRRCIRFSRDWQYGGLEIVNLFAFRTPTRTIYTGQKIQLVAKMTNILLWQRCGQQELFWPGEKRVPTSSGIAQCSRCCPSIVHNHCVVWGLHEMVALATPSIVHAAFIHFHIW